MEGNKMELSHKEKQVADLQSDQRGIDRKLKKAQQELERAEKRMKSLQTVR